MSRRRVEGGFSLVEVIVTIGILAVIMPAIAGAFVVWLKTDDATIARLDASNNAHFAATSFSADAQSADALDGSVSCGSGTPVVSFVRSETTFDASGAESTEQRVTAYRIASNGVDLLRAGCVVGSDGTVGPADERTVARRLDASTPPDLKCSSDGVTFSACSDGAITGLVQLTLKAADGYVYTLLNQKRTG